MIEIIPNWHPIFVHFTVALVSVSALCYLIGYFTMKYAFGQELLAVGRWCLWLGALAAIATVIAGFVAYYSVAHDTPSHQVMTIHRNWAIASFIIILAVFSWSVWIFYRKKVIPIIFVLSMLLLFSLLSITAWYGAELVYRYGLGVMSLPKLNQSGQSHKHDEKHQHSQPHEHSHTD